MANLAKGLSNCLSLSPIHESTKIEIVRGFWQIPQSRPLSLSKGNSLQRYFEYYTTQCDLALNDRGRHVIVWTHQDIMQIVNKVNEGYDRSNLECQLKEMPCKAESRDHEMAVKLSIDLACRLITMIEIGSVPQSFSGRRELQWKTSSLQDFIADLCNPKYNRNESVRLERLFVARNLPRIARIEILWTDNLADHLRMLEHDTKVAIFHHTSFLETVHKSHMFPSGFIDETLRSIALLFPQPDRATKKWYTREAQAHSLDPKLIKSGFLKVEDRNIEVFKFWRDRIVMLKQAFDDSEPTSWSQWWYDKRRGVHRYPLLIAALGLSLTAFFGLIQCIEGALQVWKAYHPPEP